MQPFKLMVYLGFLSGLLLLLGGAGQSYMSARLGGDARIGFGGLTGGDLMRVGIVCWASSGLSLAIRWCGTVAPMGEAWRALLWGTLLALATGYLGYLGIRDWAGESSSGNVLVVFGIPMLFVLFRTSSWIAGFAAQWICCTT